MKVLFAVAAVVGAVAALSPLPDGPSFASCADKVKCSVYNSNKNEVLRCKPNYADSTTPCTEAYCCAPPPPPSSFTTCAAFLKDSKVGCEYGISQERCKPRPSSTMACSIDYCCKPKPKPPSFAPCDKEVKCQYGYAQSRCKPNYAGSTTPCTVAYCCKPAPPKPDSFVSCKSKYDCKYGYAEDRCKPRYDSDYSCSETFCCKPMPKPDPPKPAKLVECFKNGVACRVYKKDPKTGGQMRCKKVSWETKSPCNQEHCCAPAIIY